jgi:hypothetical protein
MIEYEIGGKKYFQKPIVLGQISQIESFLTKNNIPLGEGPEALIRFMGSKLSEGLAIVLQEEGVPLKDKDLSKLADDLAFTVDFETALKIVTDFFVCNPTNSILEKLGGAIGSIKRAVMIRTILSENLSASSAEATSQKETISSGDTPSQTANPT